MKKVEKPAKLEKCEKSFLSLWFYQYTTTAMITNPITTLVIPSGTNLPPLFSMFVAFNRLFGVDLESSGFTVLVVGDGATILRSQHSFETQVAVAHVTSPGNVFN